MNLKNVKLAGSILFLLSWSIMLAGTIVYCTVNYARAVVIVLLIVGLIFGACLGASCIFNRLGEWKNILHISVTVLLLLATVLSVYNQLDAIGYCLAGLTPFSVIQNYVISIILLGIASVSAIISLFFGLYKEA